MKKYPGPKTSSCTDHKNQMVPPLFARGITSKSLNTKKNIILRFLQTTLPVTSKAMLVIWGVWRVYPYDFVMVLTLGSLVSAFVVVVLLGSLVSAFVVVVLLFGTELWYLLIICIHSLTA